ncbi:hypothetical protein [Streptomyces griseocarneus]|uniref:hypothetical protein n=1 Tax=Streptomyces griseocarneus TaxID=51201 RepID=UPI00167CEF8B|nr:hypothetical protein [Streptomyces griseocarneus]MBZ6474739.1 hypothetical protein [Streptomyces griseocarneus]
MQPLRSRMPEQEVCEIGRVFTEELSAQNAPRLFPDALASRDLSECYSVADLFADLPGLRSESLGQPNIGLVDLDAPTGGLPGSEEVTAAVDAYGYGYGATMVTASRRQPEAVADLAPVHARVTPASFTSVRRFDGEDDAGLFWALSASGDVDRTERASFTRTFGGMRAGRGADFDPEIVLFDGPVVHGLMCHIEVWEADRSSPVGHDQLLRDLWGISGFLSQASHCIGLCPDGPSPSASDALEILALTAALIAATMRFWRSEDDLVAQRTIGFDRSAIRSMGGQSGRAGTWRFGGGSGGTYELSLKWTGPGDTRLLTTATASTWSTGTPVPSVTALGTPALAVHDGKLYCMIRGAGSDESLSWTTLNGNTWNPFTDITATSYAAPALAAFDNRLYAVHRSGTS